MTEIRPRNSDRFPWGGRRGRFRDRLCYDAVRRPTMAEKGKKDKGIKEQKKKPKLDPKEKRKLKREKKAG